MGKLIYFTPTSLDGYISDETGNLDWSAPDEEVFAFITDLVRHVGMHLYGRKMYETMVVWEAPDVIPGLTPALLDFARIWQAAHKIVYSKSRERLFCEDASRAGIQPTGGSRPEGSIASRCFGGWSDTRRPRSGPGSSTSIICSSCLPCLAAASGSCPAMYA